MRDKEGDKNSKMKLTIFYISLLIITLGVFLFLELKPAIDIPDINGDEAVVGCTALLVKNNIHSNGDFDFLGRHLPLNIYCGTYRGALEGYLLLPFILIKGITFEGLRIGPIIFGILIILMTYWFASKFLNLTVGIITTILIALNSSFLNIIKLGGAFAFSLPFFSLSSLFFFLEFHNTKKTSYLYLGMFFLALGYNAAGFFIWFIISLFLSWLLLYCSRYKIKLKTLCIASLFLIAGLIPIFYCYLRIDLLRSFAFPNFHRTTYGADNFLFYNNFLIRLQQLNGILIGEVWRGGKFLKFPVFFFWISLAFISYKLFVKKTNLSRKRILFILCLFGFGLISSVYTFTYYWPSHSYLLMPFTQLIMGIAVWEAYKTCGNKVISIIPVILLLLLVGFHIGRGILRYQQLEWERLENNHCSIYDLTKWLLDNKIFKIAYYDINAQFGISFLSNMRINNHYFYYSPIPTETIREAVSAASIDNISIIVNLLNPENTTAYDHIKSCAQLLGKEIIIRKTFFTKSGRTKFLVLDIR